MYFETREGVLAATLQCVIAQLRAPFDLALSALCATA
jgi:hypothetical protein